MEGSMDELNTVKREASQVCAAVQRSTSLDSMPPPSNMSTLQFLSNGSSNNTNTNTNTKPDESNNMLPVMVNVNNSMPSGSQPCPVQRSRSLPLLDQSPLDTDDILAELANRANTGNNVTTVGDGIDPLTVETMAQQDGSLNGADDSGSNQDLNSVGSIPHQDYSTGPSTPTTPHHIPDQSKMSLHLNHQDLSPPPHSGHMPLQPLNLSQNIDSKLFSQSLPPNLFATLRPNQGRDYLSQQQTLPSNWPSGIPDSRFTFRNTETFATYPGLSLTGLNQGRNSPFTSSYSLLRDGDKPPQFPPDVYNSIGISQGLHFSRSLMQLQQAPFVRTQLPRDVEPTLEETVRVVSSIAGEPVENNNILKSTANMQQAFHEAVSNSLADKYTLSGNLSMSMPETSQGSPVTVGQKSNSPALRLKPMSDHMLSMINTYSEEQLLSESGNLMSNSPVMMDESFLTSAMNSGAMSRLQEASNLPQVDNHSPSVNNEPFDLLGGSGDVEDSNFMPHGISPPQPPLGIDQAGTTNANLLNYTPTSSATHGDMKGHIATGGGNNNQQLTGSSPGDGPSKPKKGRPRAGAQGHRYSQPCPTCGKVFGSSSALAKHKLIHSSERRHKCILCAKSFKRQDHLTGHMLTHRSRKPYECTVDNCNKSYCDIRSLRRHFESQHPGLVMEDNMNYTGDEKDPELMRAEAAARQAQSQSFPTSASPQQNDYIVNYATTSPPTSVTNQESDSSSGSSSSAALQYLAQAAQRANTSTLSTLANVAAGQNLALSNNQEPPDISMQNPPSSFANDITGHFLSGNASQSLPSVSLGSIPSGSSGLTVSVSAPRIPESSMGPSYQQPSMMSSPPKKTSTAKPNKQDKERTMVKCSICSKTFKSMPALNGHMRLHGGYNSSRTATPPSSSQDQVKRPPKTVPSQVPSSFPASNMDFSPAAYSHHVVMPQHNVSVPPPQPSSGPNMVSFVSSSRYPPPENTYRSGMLPAAQPVIGGTHPGPVPMGHHPLLQPSQLLQAHSRQLDYNLPRPSGLPTSYPHSGLSSLSQAAIKLEADAKNSCLGQLPDTSTALNLSAPRRNVITPSPPDLEAELKHQLMDDSKHMLDRKSPLSSLQPSLSYQSPQTKVERDLEKDVFRDPTPVQMSPTKRKQRPPSLIIPAWATTGNPGGILPSAFQSQMRSPREIGAGFIYRTNSTTPPPYTPPPMLSPIRSGSGLYFSANSTGGNRVTAHPVPPGSTPTTPSMLQFHRRTSTSGPTEETDLVFSSEPHINVGSDFQAVIPELEKGPCPDEEDEREGTLMWSTETNKLYPEVEVHYFLDLACTPTLPGGARNTEFAYHCLQRAQGDIEIALMMLLNQKPLLPKNVRVNGYKYDFTTPWSQSERKSFRDMYKAKGKDFHEIQKGIPTKSAKDCIEYYYFWKKLYPYNADMQKFCHHSGVTPNEEMRKQECDLFPDEVFLDYVPLKEYRSDKYGRCIEDEPSSKTTTNKPASSEKTSGKSDGPFLCSYPECQASFKSRQALNGHIRVHGGLYKGDKVAPKPKPRSPSASDSSAEEDEEEDDNDNAEEEEDGARESTGEDASSSDDMSEDGNEDRYPCKICGKVFSKIKSRSAHMKSHRKGDENDAPGPPMMSSETADSQEEGPAVRPSISSSMSDGEVEDYGMGWESESSSNNGPMEESMSSDGEMSE